MSGITASVSTKSTSSGKADRPEMAQHKQGAPSKHDGPSGRASGVKRSQHDMEDGAAPHAIG